MDCIIVDKNVIDNHIEWFLIKTNLKQYIECINDEFFKFPVQRKIVKNKYLDELLETLKRGEPAPILTLSYNATITKSNAGENVDLDMENVNILDGLQRTYRMKAYWDVCKYLEKNVTDYSKIADIIKDLRKKYEEYFKTGVISSKLIKQILTEDKGKVILDINIDDIYGRVNQYFEIWIGLNQNETIRKMLILNAGHKPVTAQHQFELLFLHIWYELKNNLEGIVLYREKDEQFNDVKSGKRRAGEYIFSNVINSLISLSSEKPHRISTDAVYKFDLLEEEKSLQNIEVFLSTSFIKKYLLKLKELDEIVYEKNGADGLSWFHKDTTLSGIMAGIGKYVSASNKSGFDLEDRTLSAIEKMKLSFSNNSLNLQQFNDNYNKLAGRSINIGMFIRKIIMEFTLCVLQDNQKDWNILYKEVEK